MFVRPPRWACVLWWKRSPPQFRKLFPHCVHKYGFSPVWMRKWRVSAHECRKRAVHSVQAYGFSPVWILWWILRCSMRLKSRPHCGQRNGLRPGGYKLRLGLFCWWLVGLGCRTLRYLRTFSGIEKASPKPCPCPELWLGKSGSGVGIVREEASLRESGAWHTPGWLEEADTRKSIPGSSPWKREGLAIGVTRHTKNTNGLLEIRHYDIFISRAIMIFSKQLVKQHFNRKITS